MELQIRYIWYQSELLPFIVSNERIKRGDIVIEKCVLETLDNNGYYNYKNPFTNSIERIRYNIHELYWDHRVSKSNTDNSLWARGYTGDKLQTLCTKIIIPKLVGINIPL